MDSTGDGKFCPVASIISPELSRPQNMTMKLSENHAPVIYSIEHIFYCPPHHIAMETHKGIAREFDPTDPNRKKKRKEKKRKGDAYAATISRVLSRRLFPLRDHDVLWCQSTSPYYWAQRYHDQSKFGDAGEDRRVDSRGASVQSTSGQSSTPHYTIYLHDSAACMRDLLTWSSASSLDGSLC